MRIEGGIEADVALPIPLPPYAPIPVRSPPSAMDRFGRGARYRLWSPNKPHPFASVTVTLSLFRYVSNVSDARRYKGPSYYRLLRFHVKCVFT